jgi:hypothetical protein
MKWAALEPTVYYYWSQTNIASSLALKLPLGVMRVILNRMHMNIDI